MKNRIQIDGVWYVREEDVQDQIEEIATFSECYTVETKDHCFEARHIKKNDGTFYGDVSVEVTYKKDRKREDWENDYWDNNAWFKGVLGNNQNSIKTLMHDIPDEKERYVFIQMLKKLVEIGWLK